jgi:hypothetical protein
MKFKAFLATTALIATVVAPVSVAFAAEPVTISTEPVVAVSDTVPSDKAMIDELASLKLKLKDPATGSITRFILKFQIKQLENQLNIKKALQENPA